MNTFLVANTILKYFINKNEPIKNMKLQKLVFFSCGFYFASKNGKKWLIDHDFNAWPYGPVCTELYAKLAYSEKNPIKQEIKIKSNDFEDGAFDIIQNVIKRYGHLSDWELSNITHKQDSPWANTINKHYIGHIIKREYIIKFFKKRIK